MAPLRLCAFILLLYWTTSSGQSHDLTSSDLSLPNRVKRDQPFETREKVRATFDVVKDALSVFKDTAELQKFAESTKDVLKKLSNFASMAPGCAGAIFSVVNMVLAFIPQDDPVLNAVKEGFAEVNRKLDSIAFQVSNLATDVEWFNYASVYSKDELNILNAWRKFEEFQKNSELAKSQEEVLRQAEIFANYYEYTGTEASVANLYHYLTIDTVSLVGNLNTLLRNKLKCDIGQMGKYNFYFSTLLLRGVVLNEAYWKMIGLNPSNKEVTNAKMFREVYRAQFSGVEYCLKKHKEYMKKDVEEISKGISPSQKTNIAEEVKAHLDRKYDWYNWVVLVYKTEDDGNYILREMTKIPVGTVTVAVGHTLKVKEEEEIHKMHVIKAIDTCFEGAYCQDLHPEEYKCRYRDDRGFLQPGVDPLVVRVKDYVKVTHVIYGTEYAERPNPFYQHGCSWGSSTSQIHTFYSRSLSGVCSDDTCLNGGQCKRMLDSNDSLCECQDGYYGNRCEEEMDTSLAQKTNALYPVPTITSTSGRLANMQTQMKAIFDIINDRCPS